jgi:hypothetical protein
MTTSLDELLESFDLNEENQEEVDIHDLDNDELQEVIMNLQEPLEKRVSYLETYYTRVKDDTIGVLGTLAGMYQMSGSKLLEQFFYHICKSDILSSFIKYEASKNILDYEEMEELSDSDEEDEEKQARKERNAEIQKSNQQRKSIGYNALNMVCKNTTGMPTPYRVDAIFRLMDSEFGHKTNAQTYMDNLVVDSNIQCDYRYKTIMALENRSAKYFREEIGKLFSDQKFVRHVYDKTRFSIERLFTNIKLNVKDSRLWHNILFHLDYDDLRELYKERFPGKQCGYDIFISSAQQAFLFCRENDVYYRVLSAQYLLQKCKLEPKVAEQVCTELELIAKNTEFDYNRRADSADVLLQMGVTNRYKEIGREIINDLANVHGVSRTLFDNAQNVHAAKVEESVIDALEFLNAMPLARNGDKPIDLDFVRCEIECMLKVQRESRYVANTVKKDTKKCTYCSSSILKAEEYNDIQFCSSKCVEMYKRDNKIRLALNRIQMDRALYSRFNSSLVNILLRVWTYLSGNEHENEMRLRMLEELEEMSGTCSSGFATRLINVISGFGEFNIRISWEDQIRGNLTGRLNAHIRKICDTDSIFREKELMNQIVQLWLETEEGTETKKYVHNILRENDIRTKGDKEKHEFIRTIILTKTTEENCLVEFAGEVLNQMTLNSSEYDKRKHFMFFFRTVLPSIREELYEEFKTLVDDADFDLYMRKAIVSYEGEN